MLEEECWVEEADLSTLWGFQGRLRVWASDAGDAGQALDASSQVVGRSAWQMAGEPHYLHRST